MIRLSQSLITKTDNLTRLFVAVLLMLLIIHPLTGKASQKQGPRESNWFISGSTGMALLAGEISTDLSFLPREFNHKPGFSFDLSLGRTLGRRWETQFRLAVYSLFGESDLPRFSAEGLHPSFPNTLHQVPVEYLTHSSSGSLVFRYLLYENPRKQNNSLNLNPFIEAGLGINSFTSKLRYQELPPGEISSVIFRKGSAEKNFGVSQVITGIGTKIGPYRDWNAVLLLNAEWGNYDTFDAVYNFTEGLRNHANGIVIRLTAGISIPFRRNIKSDKYLPFSW